MPAKKTTKKSVAADKEKAVVKEKVEAKPVEEKPVEKKAAARKAPAKKTAEKKAAPKKTAARKAPAKKTAEKKAAPKKTAAKKTVAKKAEVRKEEAPAVVKKSAQDYKDIINWKKGEAHAMDWLYIEINAGDLLTEVEAGVDNLKTACDAMLETMLEGDDFIVKPNEEDMVNSSLTIRYYCDNLSEDRRSYWEV